MIDYEIIQHDLYVEIDFSYDDEIINNISVYKIRYGETEEQQEFEIIADESETYNFKIASSRPLTIEIKAFDNETEIESVSFEAKARLISQTFSVISFSYNKEIENNIWYYKIIYDGTEEKLIASQSPIYNFIIELEEINEVQVIAVNFEDDEVEEIEYEFVDYVSPLTINELYGYWSDHSKQNHRIMHWKLPIIIFQQSEFLNYELELKEDDDVKYYTETSEAEEFVEFQNGKFVKAFAIDVKNRKQKIDRNFQWRVRTFFQQEGIYGIWRSPWSEYRHFVLKKQNDLEETENRFFDLADDNIYNKDILKLSLEEREKYNVWKVMRFLSKTIEEENWDLERKVSDLDFEEIRDNALQNFSNFHLSINKKESETWSEYRYKLLKIKNAFASWSGRYRAVEEVVEAFTGIKPIISPFKMSYGWVLGDFGVESHILTKTFNYFINEEGNTYKEVNKELPGTYKDSTLYHKNTYGYGILIKVYDPFELLDDEDKQLMEHIVRKIIQKHYKVYFEYILDFAPELLVWDVGMWDVGMWD